MSESAGTDSILRGQSMPRPYSEDLRARVIEEIEAGASRREAAERYELSPSVVVIWARRWEETGSVAAKPSGGSTSPLAHLMHANAWTEVGILRACSSVLRASVGSSFGSRTLSTRWGDWTGLAEGIAAPVVHGPDGCSLSATRPNVCASGQHEASAMRMRLAVSMMRPAILRRRRRIVANSVCCSGIQLGIAARRSSSSQ